MLWVRYLGLWVLALGIWVLLVTWVFAFNATTALSSPDRGSAAGTRCPYKDRPLVYRPLLAAFSRTARPPHSWPEPLCWADKPHEWIAADSGRPKNSPHRQRPRAWAPPTRNPEPTTCRGAPAASAEAGWRRAASFSRPLHGS